MGDKKRKKRYYSQLEEKETGDLYYEYKKWIHAMFDRFPDLYKHFSHLLTEYEGETWITVTDPTDTKFSFDYGSWWPNEDDRIWMGVVNDVPLRMSNPFNY